MTEFENDPVLADIDADAFTAPEDMPGDQQEGNDSGGGRRRWVGWLRAGAVAIVAFGIGVGVTYAQTQDYTDTDEYAAAQAELADRDADLGERDGELDARESELSEFEDEVAGLDQRAADLDQRNEDLDTREADLDTREADLETRSGDLDTRSSELDDREEAISTAEAEYEAGTIPGDGTFLVGTDIEPGEYRGNAGSGMCYWARLSGTSGDFSDLIANGNADGPTVVTIAESDVAFETNRCGEWHLIQ